MHTLIKKIQSEAGFTLIEIIVTLVVVSIIMTSVTPFIKVQVDAYISGLNAKFALQTVRIGMERALSEMRNARSLSSGGGDINTANGTKFDFDNENGEKITISYGKFTANGNSSMSLLFNVNNDDETPLIYNVSECTFTYLNAAGDETTTKSDIRVIRIAITVEDPDTGMTHEIANQVAPANFRF